MTDQEKRDFTVRIAGANPVSMITILYDMTLTYLKEANEMDAETERQSYRSSLHHAQDCLTELRNSVNSSVVPGMELIQLYLFLHRLISRAIVSGERAVLEDCERIIRTLRETNRKVETMGSWESVMSNTQNVYAGLTYGRTSLVECVNDNNGNRGFLA